MKNNIKISLSKNAVDFLLFGYLGIKSDDLHKSENELNLIKICAQRAYLDLNRTLKFSPEYKNDKNNKNDSKEDLKNKAEMRLTFKNNICEYISKHIVNELICGKDFDCDHKKFCEKIIGISKECGVISGGMSYGQAQKWINMTIKYMLILGKWDEQFEKIIDKIHVPVDSYIIDAAKKGIDLKAGEKVTTDTKVWSKWEYKEYLEFQNNLRSAVNGNPIEWEGPAWIKIAKERKEKTIKIY